ncbi:MAG: NADH-quinone oxidoreductase subunit NuoF [Candidatus Bathyarchaeum sp.]|nr:MAG: NADH-quinone oxidoreductase subunit NuoF [Candidatus Bathyarchaeum sp.]
MPRLNSPKEFEELRKKILSKRDKNKLGISISSGTCGRAYGSDKIAAAFIHELKKQGLEEKIDFREVGCLGFCEREPLAIIFPKGISYCNVKIEDVPEIVDKTVKGEIIERLLYTDPVSGEKMTHEEEIPFYKHQKKIVFGNIARIDPKNIEDYIALGGYSALAKALSEMTPEEVLEEVKKAKLRGRGGGGFPTSIKWASTRKAHGEPKYVIVNCDEGDPGAYMNRGLMEGNPHSVLEGLILGAYAIGSSEGFFYIRQEYPLAVENTELAIKQAEEYGLLGKNILGSGFDFTVKIHEGAGAFVSGESSALMTAIEGSVGEPRPKYVHTSEKGVWEKPSTLNNVETWANIPLIINKGAEWFNTIGTEGSKGTKIFSLVGKVNNTGLVEVALGTPLREIIYEIGGGIQKGKKFKGVQTGGPSGGVIPNQYLDAPVDFDELTRLGSMMGSGGMIVMDEDTCMVDVARYFVNFLCDESCGKCLPCREGLKQASVILQKIVAGKGTAVDLQNLADIAEVTSVASLCALGKTSANPVLTTLRYFRDEYEAHINEKRCPALVCKELISYYIDPEKCQVCMICHRNCPADAIIGEKAKIHIIDQAKCTKCGTCYDMCPSRFGAVQKISGEPVPPPIPEEERLIKRERKKKQT